MEVLTRLGRGQLVGTLLLLFVSVLFSPLDPRLLVLLPAFDADATAFLGKAVTLVSVGFFVGYIFEQLVVAIGPFVARFVCESARTRARRTDLQAKGADLELVLRSEPVLTASILGKPRMGQFIAVAKYLSQDRFKDFPHLSPLRAFEDAIAYSLTSLMFLGLATAGTIVLAAKGEFYLTEIRALVLLSTFLLGGSLWFNAQRRQDDGYESTIVSMRERKAEIAADVERREEEARAAEIERLRIQQANEERIRQAAILNGELAKALEDIEQESVSRRAVGIATLSNAIQRDPGLLDIPGDHYATFLRAIRLAGKLHGLKDERSLEMLFRLCSNVIRATRLRSTYETIEQVTTPVLVEILSKSPVHSNEFYEALDFASLLRSRELVDAILRRVVQEPTGEVASRLRLETILGSSPLGAANVDLVHDYLKKPPFGDVPALRTVQEHVLTYLSRRDIDRGSWPPVIRDIKR